MTQIHGASGQRINDSDSHETPLIPTDPAPIDAP